jgi:hypothetical protein
MITEVIQRPQVIWIMTKQFLVRCDRFGEGLLPGIVALEAIIAAYNKQPLPFTDCMSQGECPFEVWLAELPRNSPGEPVRYAAD